MLVKVLELNPDENLSFWTDLFFKCIVFSSTSVDLHVLTNCGELFEVQAGAGLTQQVQTMVQ